MHKNLNFIIPIMFFLFIIYSIWILDKNNLIRWIMTDFCVFGICCCILNYIED